MHVLWVCDHPPNPIQSKTCIAICYHFSYVGKVSFQKTLQLIFNWFSICNRDWNSVAYWHGNVYHLVKHEVFQLSSTAIVKVAFITLALRL